MRSMRSGGAQGTGQDPVEPQSVVITVKESWVVMGGIARSRATTPERSQAAHGDKEEHP